MGKLFVEVVLEVRKVVVGVCYFVEYGVGYFVLMFIEGMNVKVVYELFGFVFGVMLWNLFFW